KTEPRKGMGGSGGAHRADAAAPDDRHQRHPLARGRGGPRRGPAPDPPPRFPRILVRLAPSDRAAGRGRLPRPRSGPAGLHPIGRLSPGRGWEGREVHTELTPRHRTIATNGIHLHAVEAGPEGGPLLILLHGFPEFWYGWRHQIEPLAAAGFRVLAPDQRGYNLSDKPKRISAYNLDTLARDVLGLIDDAGARKARVVGHDW